MEKLDHTKTQEFKLNKKRSDENFNNKTFILTGKTIGAYAILPGKVLSVKGIVTLTSTGYAMLNPKLICASKEYFLKLLLNN